MLIVNKVHVYNLSILIRYQVLQRKNLSAPENFVHFGLLSEYHFCVDKAVLFCPDPNRNFRRDRIQIPLREEGAPALLFGLSVSEGHDPEFRGAVNFPADAGMGCQREMDDRNLRILRRHCLGDCTARHPWIFPAYLKYSSCSFCCSHITSPLRSSDMFSVEQIRCIICCPGNILILYRLRPAAQRSATNYPSPFVYEPQKCLSS